MAVRILHCADLHMDSPLESLSPEKATVMRREQRELVMNIADIAKENEVDLVFFAGDIFDSALAYYETCDVLSEAFEKIAVPVFIAPGNHDYFCSASPYAFMSFSENVHVFKSQIIESVELEDLGVRVYGAGFTSADSANILSGFTVQDDDKINLAVLHANLMGEAYNRITVENIAESGLDYLALGHIHAYSGLCTAGKTCYAYPGCPQGRGFDETGDKGVIIAEVSKYDTQIRFVPTAKRKYLELSCDVSKFPSVSEAAADALGAYNTDNIVRLTLTGERPNDFDCAEIENELKDAAFTITVRDRTTYARDIWEGLSEDTLRGSFLRIMNKKLAAAETDEEKDKIMLAVKYALAALENREEREI